MSRLHTSAASSRARFIAASAVLGALASCATTPEYEATLASWKGGQESELIRRWGPPRQTYEARGRKFLVYESHRIVFIPGTAAVSPNGTPIGASAGMDIEMTCKTTFELEDAAVVATSYSGNGCGAQRNSSYRR